MLSQQNPIKRFPRHPLNRQAGVVIVMALFMVALAAAISYVLIGRLQRDTERTSLILRNTQAEFYAGGSLAWAMDTLKLNFDKRKPNQRVDILPLKSPVNTENGYVIYSTIYDVQGRFNLNVITSPEGEFAFGRLFKTLLPSEQDQKIKEIAAAVKAWLNPASTNIPSDLDRYYLSLSNPYRAAHRPMLSVSELRLVKGMTPKIYSALEPYLIALPADTLMNVQSAKAPALMTLSPKLTIEAAKSLEEILAGGAILSSEQFQQLDLVKNFQLTNKITFISHYFLVETVVTIENQRILFYTLLERILNNGRVGFRIVWQSKGIW